jgi:hypothetical protein
MRSPVVKRPIFFVLALFTSALAFAQFEMPDPKQMSGIPRPVDDLPQGSISVRLIRGELSNNITNHPVTLIVNGKPLTANTDDAGRAQFDKVEPGATVKAAADVDGEHLESQEFASPQRGGVRLMLVATDPNKAAKANAPAVPGDVTLTSQSRIVMEPGDEAVTLYYLLSISNRAQTPVNPPTLFMFDMPKECIGTTIMEGSTNKASAKDARVRVEGPFPPGETFVQSACQLPALTGGVSFTQSFPAKLDQLAVIVKKVGDAKLESPQLTRQQEFPVAEGMYIAGTGGTIEAGQPISVDVSGLPHHSMVPRWIAVTLAMAILFAGVWSAQRPDDSASARAAERKRLLAKRDRLFADLVRLETDHRNGRVDDRRHGVRREELIAALEHIYGALDTDDAGPEPADRAGVAA